MKTAGAEPDRTPFPPAGTGTPRHVERREAGDVPPLAERPFRAVPAARTFRRDVDRLARFFGIPRRQHLPAALAPASVAARAEQLARGAFDPGLRMLLQQIDQSPILDGNRVQVYFGAPGALDAMRCAIESARSEILVEFYVLADEAGRRLAEPLARAQERGVAVRVLADASHRRGDAPFWEPLRRAGIDLRLFQPFFKSPWYRPPRDHRKILVVDRTVLFTGGRESRLEPLDGPAPALRDVYVRVEGKTALEMAAVFADGWERARGGGLVFEPDAKTPSMHEDGASILVLDSPPWRTHKEAASVLTAVAASARRSLWISSPCFSPKRFVIEALGRAAERGVDVRLLLAERGDSPLSRSASRASSYELLERGVSVYVHPGASLQAKLMIADDTISVVGSTNLDFRYFGLNAECDLVIFEAATARTLAAAFEHDISGSHELAKGAGRRSFLPRVIDDLARGVVTAL